MADTIPISGLPSGTPKLTDIELEVDTTDLSSAPSGTTKKITRAAEVTFLNSNLSLGVPQGGTGIYSATTYGLICGGTTSTGNLQSLSTGNSGQILVSQGSGALPQWINLGGIGVTSIMGTANQVLVNGTTGSAQTGVITLTLPQSIGMLSNVQFGQVIMSPTGSSLTGNNVCYVTGTITLNTVGVQSGFYLDTILTPQANSSLIYSAGFKPNFAVGTNTVTTGAAVYVLAGSVTGSGSVTNGYGLYVNTPVFAANNYCAYFQGNVGIGTAIPASTDLLTISGTLNNQVTINGTQTASVTNGNALYINPTFNGPSSCAGILCTPNFNGANLKTHTNGIYISNNVSSNAGTIGTNIGLWIDTGSGGGGTINTSYGLYVANPASGTASYCAYFGGNVGIGITTPAQSLQVNGSIVVGNTNYVGFQAGSLSANTIWTLPTADGTNGQALITNGSKILSWASINNSITGTLNQVLVNGTTGSAQTGAITLTLPQSIGMLSNVQFGQVIMSPTGSSLTGNNVCYVTGTITLNTVGVQSGFYLDTILTPQANSSLIYSAGFKPNFAVGTNTVTTGAAVYVLAGSVTGSGSVTNGYGLYVNTPVFAANNYCAYFQGNVGIGILPNLNSQCSIAPTVSTSLGSPIWGFLLGQGTFTYAANGNQTRLFACGYQTLATSTFTGLSAICQHLAVSTYSKTGTGTLSSAVALMIDGWPGSFATEQYGIYQGGTDQNYFNGNIGVMTSTPSWPIDIEGSRSTRIALNIGSNQTSSGNHVPLTVDVNCITSGSTNIVSQVYINGTVTATSGSVTNACGIYVDTGNSPSGTITNGYGLYVNTPAAGTNKIGAYFGGNVGIGVSVPTDSLDIAGAIRCSTNPTPAYDSVSSLFFTQNGVGPTIVGEAIQFITSGGTSNNVSLYLQPSGVVKFGASGSFTANGTTATILTSLGPSGAHALVQTWLTIIDSTGTARYIPCF